MQYKVGLIEGHDVIYVPERNQIFCKNTAVNFSTIEKIIRGSTMRETIPEKNLTNAAMNSSTTTSGGYVGSDMFNSVLPTWAGHLETALGAVHVLQTNEYLTSSVDANAKNVMRPNLTGASNACTHKNCKANLLSLIFPL